MSVGVKQHDAPYEFIEIRAREQIRLFTILLDQDDEDEYDKDKDDGDDGNNDTFDGKHRMRIQLHVYERGSEPAYEALSYTWGDPEKSEMIICNDRILNVTRNCLEAMRALRLRQRRKIDRLHSHGVPYEDKVPSWIRNLKQSRSLIDPDCKVAHLWIDAVCIDQSNTTERSGQVSIMGTIFQDAHCTIVYLGPMDESASNVLTRMERLDLHSLVCSPERRYLRQMPLPMSTEFVSDWKAFYVRPWFTRSWVVQEALLSRQLTVLVGNDEFYWDLLALGSRLKGDVLAAYRLAPDAFEDVVVYAFLNLDLPVHAPFRKDLLKEVEVGPSVDPGPHSHGNSNTTPTSWWSDSNNTYVRADHRMYAPTLLDRNDSLPAEVVEAFEVYDLLESTKRLQCQDPRDKLFAIHALLGTNSADLVVDYDKSVSRVFADLSWYLICRGVFAALSSAGIRQRTAELKYPSWVADWSEHYGRTDPNITANLQLHFDQAFQPQICERFQFRTKRVGYAIAIPGRILDDRVTKTGQTNGNSLEGDTALDTFQTACGARGSSMSALEVGDQFCLFGGCQALFMLRPCCRGWRFVGQCYYGRGLPADTTLTVQMASSDMRSEPSLTELHDIWLV